VIDAQVTQARATVITYMGRGWQDSGDMIDVVISIDALFFFAAGTGLRYTMFSESNISRVRRDQAAGRTWIAPHGQRTFAAGFL